ncbi:MAG: rubrerythrin [Leptospiraceae bacterium]|nr:rubrerythrin [Leptospiraceae bacterium]
MGAFLEAVIGCPSIHARWLNTLSLLEFMGSRKIARSLSGAFCDEQRLRHLAEEARHAHFFKRAIERIPQAPVLQGYTVEQTLSRTAAALYFHGLDARVKHRLQEVCATMDDNSFTELCYLYVTTLVEERAARVYPLYDSILEKHGIPVRLQGIIGEEDRHLAAMHASLARQPDHRDELLSELRLMEEGLFARFFAALERDVARLKLAA